MKGSVKIDRPFGPAPQVAKVPFRTGEFRGFFKTEEGFLKAMEMAKQLEIKNCPTRAWRVRLNLDNTF